MGEIFSRSRAEAGRRCHTWRVPPSIVVLQALDSGRRADVILERLQVGSRRPSGRRSARTTRPGCRAGCCPTRRAPRSSSASRPSMPTGATTSWSASRDRARAAVRDAIPRPASVASLLTARPARARCELGDVACARHPADAAACPASSRTGA